MILHQLVKDFGGTKMIGAQGMKRVVGDLPFGVKKQDLTACSFVIRRDQLL